MSDEKWFCKYCKKSVNEKRKNDHRQIKHHKIKARWYKYFRDIDEAMKGVKKAFDRGDCTVDEYNEIEQEIFDEVDRLDNDGHYHIWPDSD